MTHQHHAPFIGVILAGDFTDGALTQLRSLGFRVLYFSYDSIVAAFDSVGIDARLTKTRRTPPVRRRFRPGTRGTARTKTDRTASSSAAGRPSGPNSVLAGRSHQWQINRVVVLPLHGTPFTWETVDAAIGFIEAYSETDPVPKPVARYEIQIRYDNNDSIRGEFVEKEGAVLLPHLPAAAAACGGLSRMVALRASSCRSRTVKAPTPGP